MFFFFSLFVYVNPLFCPCVTKQSKVRGEARFLYVWGGIRGMDILDRNTLLQGRRRR